MAQKPKSPIRRKSKPAAKPKKSAKSQKPRAPLSIFSILDEALNFLRTIQPGLRAAAPLPAGTVGPELPFTAPVFGRMILASAMQGNQGSIIWTKDDSELEVTTGKITVNLGDGLILFNIPVTCDQASGATVQVPFAVGGTNSPAGLLMATEDQPRGPDAVVIVWSDALHAYAFKLLMTVVTQAAAAAGTDADGAPMIPIAITANSDQVTVLTMARHTFDRVAS